jgi:hypothetical protein
MPGQHSVEDSRSSHAALDKALASSGVVDRELFLRFRDAYGYQSASTVGWVEGRLRVLRGRIDQGQSVELFVPESGGPMVVDAMAVFERWARTYFPDGELSPPDQ